MKVLIGCECSQVICEAFRRHGHDAWSCDIQPSYGNLPQFHIQDDLLNVFKSRYFDLMILHPPCTYLSNASAVRMFPSGELNAWRYEQMLLARDFFYQCLDAPCSRVCVENPIPLGICNLPIQSQIIQPYEFGDPYSKRTCLWLRGLPPLFSTSLCVPESSWVMSHHSQKDRSKSFPGIADAMATQWGDWLD